jgi:hypothetical protein
VWLAHSRRLSPDDHVWCHGWEGWRRADSVPQLFGAPPPPADVVRAAQRANPSSEVGAALDKHALNLGAAVTIVGSVVSLCDFLEKVGPFTTVAVVASATGLMLIWALYNTGYLSAQVGKNACLALGLMLVGSASVKAAQILIPGASENGVIAQVVPGASALQNTMLSSLGRIEHQTKRVSEILEDNARRDQQARDVEAKVQSEKADEFKARIAEGGYSLDEAGYLSAARDNFRYIEDFRALGIKLTEAGLRNFLAQFERDTHQTITYSEPLERFGSFLAEQRDANAAVRKVVAAIGDDGKRMSAAYKAKGARAAVCDATGYGVPVAVEGLAAACALDGTAFADAYAFYFNGTYGKLMMLTFVDRNPFIAADAYVAADVGDLPIKKVAGPLVLSKLAGCAYYEGELTFEVDDYQTEATASIGGKSSPDGAYFTLVDEAARNGGIQSLCSGATTYGTPLCRGRVIVSRDCAESPGTTIVRLLSIDRPVSKTFGE